MDEDPRRKVSPGVYRANVTRFDEGEVGDGVGYGIRSIEYAIPECGDWRWRIENNSVAPWGPRASHVFLKAAVERGWFEYEVEPPDTMEV